MTPTPPIRYDINSLNAIANGKPPPGMVERCPPTTRILIGSDAAGMGWVATQDADGQLEISFSYAKKRPSNWDVQRWFELVGMTPFKEESRATGKVRHYVVQRGTMQ